jgi:hypothetical protein
MTISHMALIGTSKTSAQLVLQILNIFILKFKHEHITTCTNFIKKFKHLHCKYQSISKIHGQRNREGARLGSGSVDRGRDRGAGFRAPGAGTGCRGWARALRSESGRHGRGWGHRGWGRGIGVTASGSGAGVGVDARAPRSGQRHRAWLVVGARRRAHGRGDGRPAVRSGWAG